MFRSFLLKLNKVTCNLKNIQNPLYSTCNLSVSSSWILPINFWVLLIISEESMSIGYLLMFVFCHGIALMEKLFFSPKLVLLV